MSLFRGLGALSISYLIEELRSKTAIFWTLAFPVFFLIGFAIIFGGSEPARVTYILPGLLTISIISATFFGMTMIMVSKRETGVFRRYWVTPVNKLVVVLAHGIIALVNLSASIVVQMAVGKLVFKITVAGTIFDLVVVCFVSAIAFIPLGLIVGSVARDLKTAPAITNLLFFPMMFLSGAAFPFFLLPGWIQNMAKLLPATYVVEVLQGVIVRGDDLFILAKPLFILVLTSAVGFAMNGLLFRWESTQPIGAKRIAIAVGGLTMVYLLAMVIVPSFKMAQRPTRSGSAGSSNSPARVLKGMAVLDGLGGKIENARVVIRDGRIAEVGREDEVAIPEGALVEDFTGAFMIPGLIDSHIHLGGSGGGNASPEEFTPERQIHDLQAYLALGITGVVSLTDDPAAMKSLREAVAAGQMRAPRAYFAGASITAPHGHPAAMFEFVPGLAERLIRQVANEQEAKQAVQEMADLGVDLIKLVLEDGSEGRPLPRLSEAAFRAAVATAKELGLKTTVHAGSDADARLALDAGIDAMEHIPIDLSDETIALLVKKNIPLTPTLSVFDGYKIAATGEEINDPLVRQWVAPEVVASLKSPNSWLNMMRSNAGFVTAMERTYAQGILATQKAVGGGVKIIAGSDAGNPATFHGPGLIRELELLVTQAGLAPQEALIAATSRPADRLGKRDVGRIVKEAYADLVVLESDPTIEVSAYRKIRAVYFDGKPIDRENIFKTSAGSWQPN
jgi:imidazolonepropionase-like amidohydrolase/ABC-type polysaccharide/polyol phosphate export permease